MLFKVPFKAYEIWLGKSLCGFKIFPRYIKADGNLKATWLGGTIVISRIKERAKGNRSIQVD